MYDNDMNGACNLLQHTNQLFEIHLYFQLTDLTVLIIVILIITTALSVAHNIIIIMMTVINSYLFTKY